MDIDEADSLCRDALDHFKAQLKPGRDNMSDTKTIARLNTELRLISHNKQRTDLYAAIRALWGDDGIQQVKEWRAIERAKLINQQEPTQ